MDIQEELVGAPENHANPGRKSPVKTDTPSRYSKEAVKKMPKKVVPEQELPGIESTMPAGVAATMVADSVEDFVPGPQQLRLLARMGFEPQSLNTLVNDLQIEVSEASGLLLELELASYIVRLNDGRYQRVR